MQVASTTRDVNQEAVAEEGVVDVWTLTDAINLMPHCQDIEELADKSPYVYTEGEQSIRFSASKVAKYCGLHEYADIVEDFTEILYQNLEQMLTDDAALLSIELVTQNDELMALVNKTGEEIAPKLRNILQWTSQKHAPETTNMTTDELRKRVEILVQKAEKQKMLTGSGAQEVKRALLGRISTGLGKRNEDLAIREYERVRGWVWLSKIPHLLINYGVL